MKYYRKNVARMAVRNIGSLLGAVLIIAIGIFVFISMIDTLRNLQGQILHYYSEAGLADVFASVRGIRAEELADLENIPGIRKAEGKLSADIRMLADGQEQIVTLHLVSYEEEAGVNRLRLSRSPREDRELYIGKRMSKIYEFREGQEIRLLCGGKPFTFRYAGICDAPDYIYSVPPSGAMVPDGEVYDLACVSLPDMELLTGSAGLKTELGFLLDPGVRFEDVRSVLSERLRKNGLLSLCSRRDQVSWNMVDGEMTELIACGTVLPFLFMAISVFMTYVANRKQIERERSLIGTMKAFGMTDRELIGSYLRTGAVCGVLGALLGMLPAGLLGRFMFAMYADFFDLSDPVYHDHAVSRLLGVLVAVATGIFSAWFSVRSITRIAPAQAMRSESPKADVSGLAMRLGTDRLRPFDKLAASSMLRHPLRGLLIMLAVAFPFSLLPLLLSFQGLADQMFMDQFNKVQVYDLQLSLPYWTDPVRLEQSLDGIEDVTECEAAGLAACELLANGRSEYGMLCALEPDSAL